MSQNWPTIASLHSVTSHIRSYFSPLHNCYTNELMVHVCITASNLITGLLLLGLIHISDICLTCMSTGLQMAL